MTIWWLHPLLRKPGTSFPDPSAMSSFRRSLITWSSGFASGDYITNLVTVGLGMLEIGAHQLNDWRLREPPDFLPFCQSSAPFNTPILYLAATSSLPTTWAVQNSLWKPFSFNFKMSDHHHSSSIQGSNKKSKETYGWKAKLKFLKKI